MRGRAVELVRLVLGDDPKALTPEKALRSIIVEFPKIDAMLLSAAQQRKSRAGYSFEHHIEAMMIDGGCTMTRGGRTGKPRCSRPRRPCASAGSRSGRK